MNLKQFDTTNTVTRMTKPYIRVNSKGVFMINATAAQKIGLQPNDHIVLHQDEDREADWYLEKVEHDTGFKVRKNSASSSLLFNSCDLRNKIIDSLDALFDGTLTLPLGTDPVKGKYWPLITAALNS